MKIKKNALIGKLILACLLLSESYLSFANQAEIPAILSDKSVMDKHFLPDFSYAGYQFGETDIPTAYAHTLNVVDFGATANDGTDDSEAFKSALKKANELQGYVNIHVPSGKFNINKIIYINRSKTVLKGVGTGKNGTTLFFDRPLRFVPTPPEHEELNVYLERFDKRVKNKMSGIDSLFSQYSWSGGYIWVAKQGKSYKSYNIPEYNQSVTTLSKASAGKQGEHKIQVSNSSALKEGNTYKLAWFNKDGKNGSLLKHMYNNKNVTIGEHHWNNPDSPLATQMVVVTKVEKNAVYIKSPLLYDVKPEWYSAFIEWEHIEEVGIENIAFEFPNSPAYPHHVEDGNNAIYLTSLMNGWVRNVRIENADSGILTDDISNVTIKDVKTHGDKIAHYTVAMGEVHNVLVKGLRVENKAIHTISFNTRSTRNIFSDCVISNNPILDQHSGTNAQNLFDNIRVYVDAPVHETYKYKLFKSGGSPRWAPEHGAFNTMYNINVHFLNPPADLKKPVVLFGTNSGVSARLIGVHANHPVEIKYEPAPYIEQTNQKLAVTSLYDYQLKQRLK